MAGEAQRRIGTLAVRSIPQSKTLLRRPICDRPAHTQRGQAMAGGALAPRAVTADPSRLGLGGLRTSLRVSRRVWATARSRWRRGARLAQKETLSLMTSPYLLNQGNVCVYGYRTGAIIKDPLSQKAAGVRFSPSGRRAGAVQHPSISLRMRSTTFGWTLGRSIPVPKPTWSPSSVEVHLSVSPQASRSV